MSSSVHAFLRGERSGRPNPSAPTQWLDTALERVLAPSVPSGRLDAILSLSRASKLPTSGVGIHAELIEVARRRADKQTGAPTAFSDVALGMGLTPEQIKNRWHLDAKGVAPDELLELVDALEASGLLPEDLRDLSWWNTQREVARGPITPQEMFALAAYAPTVLASLRLWREVTQRVSAWGPPKLEHAEGSIALALVPRGQVRRGGESGRSPLSTASNAIAALSRIKLAITTALPLLRERTRLATGIDAFVGGGAQYVRRSVGTGSGLTTARWQATEVAWLDWLYGLLAQNGITVKSPVGSDPDPLAGHAFASLPSPFRPLWDLWQTGLAPTLSQNTFILCLPELAI